MFSGLESPVHWLVLGIVALIVLGPKRLPDAGRSLGAGLRGFRDALSGRDEPASPPAAGEAPAPERSADGRRAL